MKKLFAILFLLLTPIAANAQSTKTTVVSNINVDFADNTAGAITAALLRSVTTEMVSSYVDWLTCTGQGGMAYWNASAAPTCLISGTAGQVLSTYNIPAWESLASKLAAGTGVTITGTITPTIATSPSAVLDFLGSTQNSILYRGASGWTILAPGTNGQYLRTDNPPFWTSIASAITAGTGIIVTGTITPTITVSPNAVLDTYGTTQGGVLYRGSTGWAFLSPGTSGQVFTTGGTGANPSYTTVAGTGTVQSITCGLGLTCSANPITVTGTISQTVSISSATNGAMYGVSSSAISATAAGTTGQVLMGTTGGSPSFQTAGTTLITSVSLSGASAFLFPNTITSTYDNYLVELENIIPATNGTKLLIRVSQDNGATYKSANYLDITSNTDGIYFGVNGFDNTAGFGSTGFFYISGPNRTDNYKIIRGITTTISSAAFNVANISGLYHNDFLAINAFEVIPATGNISGVVRVWGLRTTP